jgi:hypothetical protein
MQIRPSWVATTLGLALAAGLTWPGDVRADVFLDQSFPASGHRRVPMDLEAVDITLTFDAVTKSAVGVARVAFLAPDDGRPWLRMTPEPNDVTLDGNPVDVVELETPAPGIFVRSLEATVAAGSHHVLEFTYSLPRRVVRLGGSRIGFLTAMNDFPGGNYFEDYGPTGIEADAYALTLVLVAQGARETPRLFTNGQVEVLTSDPPSWEVTFPAWYTSSSFYVHLTDKRFHVVEDVVAGEEGPIPIVVYSKSARRAEAAMAELPGLFAELEGTYGPYVHDSFVALISGRGGMEHCGATITSMGALGHELTHSWFARGVLPASGRDGWMDEAVASWRDYGYERSTPDPERAPTDMASRTVFDPFAIWNVYADGRALMAELDAMVAPASGGMRELLRAWFAEAKTRAVTTEEFLAFLEGNTGLDLGAMFQRYVFGEDVPVPLPVVSRAGSGEAVVEVPFTAGAAGHPPALTARQLRRLR